jgi:hypothetical protein
MILLGDIHGDWNYLQKVVDQNPNKPIVCLGDFGYWPNTEIWPPNIMSTSAPIYFIDGNHENFWAMKENELLHWEEPKKVRGNIYYLSRGLTFNLEDKNILCCGGGESIDRVYRTIGENWFPEESISYTDICRCIEKVENEKIDLVVTHVAPSCFKIETEINLFPINKSASEKNLDHLVEAIIDTQTEMPLWIFAHYHQSASGKFGLNGKTIEWNALKIGELYRL